METTTVKKLKAAVIAHEEELERYRQQGNKTVCSNYDLSCKNR